MPNGMSTTTSARFDPRITAWPCRIIMSRVTGTVVSSPCITIPSESPTRMTIAIAVEQARGMGVVGREADDRLAALAGADVGRGQPLDFVLYRHCRRPLTHVPEKWEPVFRENMRRLKIRAHHDST